MEKIAVVAGKSLGLYGDLIIYLEKNGYKVEFCDDANQVRMMAQLSTQLVGKIPDLFIMDNALLCPRPQSRLVNRDREMGEMLFQELWMLGRSYVILHSDHRFDLAEAIELVYPIGNFRQERTGLTLVIDSNSHGLCDALIDAVNDTELPDLRPVLADIVCEAATSHGAEVFA